MKKLSASTLHQIGQVARLPIALPTFDRNALPPSIVHIGTRAFGLSFLVAAVDGHNTAVSQGGKGKLAGVVAASIKTKGVVAALAAQDGLFLHVEKGGQETKAFVRGSIVQSIFGPDNPWRLVEAIANPVTQLVTLTLSNKGYNVDWSNLSLGLRVENQDVKNDLLLTPGVANPAPLTIYWYLAEALASRQRQTVNPLTILSLDNIADNGQTLRQCLEFYLKTTGRENLLAYMDKKVDFPSSVVDRITPVVSEEVVRETCHSYGIETLALVVSEDWHQFVVERGRFDLPIDGHAGLQSVLTVDEPWNQKGFALNGGHALVGLLGQALGISTVSEAVENRFVQQLIEMFHAQTACFLGGSAVMKPYSRAIIKRFLNPWLGDRCHRVSEPSVRKTWQRLMDAIVQVLKVTGEIPRVPVFGTAVALINLYGEDENCRLIEHDPEDIHRNRLEGIYNDMIKWASSHDKVPTSRSEIQPEAMVGLLGQIAEATGYSRFSELAEVPDFVQELGFWLVYINRCGIKTAMAALLQME